MTLKERIENNLTLYTLGLLLTGFVGGITTYKFLIDANSPIVRPDGQCKADDWQSSARKEQWIPKQECPALALDLKITSPGDKSIINIDPNNRSRLETPVVIVANHVLPEQSNIGLVVKPSDEENFYVVFPFFDRATNRLTLRTTYAVDFPFHLKPESVVELRAIIVDDEKKVGSQFTSIDQIKSTDSSVYVGGPISLKFR